MRIALAQMKVNAAKPKKNLDRMLGLIEQAKKAEADLIVFPELALSGLLVGDYQRNNSFIKDCLAYNNTLAETATGIAVLFGNYSLGEEGLKNAVYLAFDGEIVEVPLFSGKETVIGCYGAFQATGGAGIFSFNMEGKDYRIAVITGNDKGMVLPDKDTVDLLINIANRPLILNEQYYQGKTAASSQCPLLYVNSCGMQNTGKAHYLMAGGSQYYDKNGELRARASLLEESLLLIDGGAGEIAPWPEEGERIFISLVEGAKEFTSLIGIKKVVIGLSGGIDSALSACVYVTALGKENVLLCNMPSRYNSSLTRGCASDLACALNTHSVTMPLEDSLNLTKCQFVQTAVTSPTGEKWYLDINSFVEENLQARDRSGRILATIAAAWGAVFTCNGNKSEAAVGYATFYGDLAGAFATICDLWKYQVYQGAAYAAKAIPEAAKALGDIASLKPSAELSPEQDIEKGKGDPLIYPYHDHLLSAWVERDATPFDILKYYQDGILEDYLGVEKGLIKKYFKDDEAFIMDLEYWWDIYQGMAVAKRIQAPPLLVLSERPLGGVLGESLVPPYWGEDYLELRNSLLLKE